MLDARGFEFLKRLCETPSPSGYEEPAQRVAAERLRELGVPLQADAHGNLIARAQEGGRPRLVLTGHVDQIGMVVRHITDEGFLHFEVIGGVNRHAFFGHRVAVHSRSGAVPGVVGRMLPHYQDPKDHDRALASYEHWIDIGATSGDQARERVRVGDPVTWVAPVERLAEHFIIGAGIDDKVSVFTAIEALAGLLAGEPRCPAEVVVVSAVQEEVTGAGAQVAAYAVDPDVAIAVDVWPMVADVPGASKERFGNIRLGAGPVIMRGANCSPVVVDLLCRAAEEESIPYQLCAWPGSTPTDASSIFRSRAGVPTGLIGLPQRYLHTPSEVVHVDDIEHSIRLLAAFARRLEPGQDFSRQAAILG